MNNARLCVAVVILCLVSPMLVGYVWPVDEGTDTANVVGKPTNITNDIVNGEVAYYGGYYDVYNNNANVFYDTNSLVGKVWANVPVQYTDVSDFISYSNSTLTYTIRQTDDDGFIEIDPTDAFWNPNDDRNVIYWHWSGADEIDLTGGEVAIAVIYYPVSNQMYWVASGSLMLHQMPVENFYYSFSQSNTNVNVYYSYGIKTDSPNPYRGQFVDLTKGFYALDDPDVFWTNGYENRTIEILLKPPSNDNTFWVKYSDGWIPSQYSYEIAAYTYSDDIYLYVSLNGDTIFHERLGSVNIYDYCLLRIDCYTKTISLNGLRGMTSFTDSYEDKIRASIECDLIPFSIESFHVSQSYSGANYDFNWFVPRTVSNITKVPGITGIVGNGVEIRDYTSGNAQIQIRSPVVWPDLVLPSSYNWGINLNGTFHQGKVDSDGILHFENKDFKLDGLIIALIDRTVYFNGEPVLEANSSVTSCNIFFRTVNPGDGWIVSLYYYPIDTVTVPTYDWMPGGFGLDETGYCMVGMIVSAITGIGASLYGRRSGSKTFLVTLVSGMIGSVYLIIMMGGL